MIRVKGIGNSELSWNYENPPKTFRKVGNRTDIDGNFAVEVFKLKSFNKITKEAVYKKWKDEKLKASEPADLNFNFASPKKQKDYEDDEF